MDQVIFYNVEHHEAMGALIVIYFFLSGLGAGAFLTAAGCRIFGGERYARIEKTAAIAAPLLLMPGLLCLIIELGKPLRFLNMFLYFNPASVASWGVWVINIFLAISVLYAFLLVIGKAEKVRPLACLGFVFALAVGFYSGMLLYQMHGHVLWHSALVPVIFLVSDIPGLRDRLRACGSTASLGLS
jgi:formate-dependent nitrite reductase membrane component NrfD